MLLSHLQMFVYGSACVCVFVILFILQIVCILWQMSVILHTPSQCVHWVWPFLYGRWRDAPNMQAYKNYLIIHSVWPLKTPCTSSHLLPTPPSTLTDSLAARDLNHTRSPRFVCVCAGLTSTHVSQAHTGTYMHKLTHKHTHTIVNRKWCGHAGWDNCSRSVCSGSKGTLAASKISSLQFCL